MRHELLLLLLLSTQSCPMCVIFAIPPPKGYFTVNDKLYCEQDARAAKAAQMITKEQNYQQHRQQQQQQQQQPVGSLKAGVLVDSSS